MAFPLSFVTASNFLSQILFLLFLWTPQPASYQEQSYDVFSGEAHFKMSSWLSLGFSQYLLVDRCQSRAVDRQVETGLSIQLIDQRRSIQPLSLKWKPGFIVTQTWIQYNTLSKYCYGKEGSIPPLLIDYISSENWYTPCWSHEEESAKMLLERTLYHDSSKTYEEFICITRDYKSASQKDGRYYTFAPPFIL